MPKGVFSLNKSLWRNDSSTCTPYEIHCKLPQYKITSVDVGFNAYYNFTFHIVDFSINFQESVVFG